MLHRLIRLVARLRAPLRHDELDRQLDEELAAHASLAEDDFVRQGMPRDEARRAAGRALGSVTQLRDEHREVRTLPLVDEFVGDARYGLRALARNPGFGVITIVILAIGIGANTAMFSVLHRVLVQPLAYPDSDRIVFVGRVNAGRGVWLSLPRVEAIRSSVTSFTGVGAYLAKSSMRSVREAVLKVDPDQSIADVRTMDEILDRSVGRQLLAAQLLSVFAGTALLLTLVGLYGVLAYSVTQRTQEIGIRRALGAGQPTVLAMVMGQALRLTLIGVAGGLVAATALTRVLESFLFQISATDPATFVVTATLFVVIAFLAALIPAWRAARIDPMKALRA